MRFTFVLLTSWWFALAPAASAVGQTLASRHARVTLVAEDVSLVPGGQSTIGVRFELDPGWHIYWRNPGEAGSPPAVRWTVPPGVTLGALQWPAPARIDADGIVSYGYHGETMLLAAVRRAAAAPPASSIIVAADVDYVICRDICIKESAAPTLSLASSATRPARSAEAPLIDRARAQVPAPLPSGWAASARLTDDDIALQVAGQFDAAVFFPLQSGVIDDGARQTVAHEGGGSSLRMKRSRYFLKAPASLEGVLVVPGRGAYAVDARWRP